MQLVPFKREGVCTHLIGGNESDRRYTTNTSWGGFDSATLRSATWTDLHFPHPHQCKLIPMKMIYITSSSQQARDFHLKLFNSYSVPALMYFLPSRGQFTHGNSFFLLWLNRGKIRHKSFLTIYGAYYFKLLVRGCSFLKLISSASHLHFCKLHLED